MFIYVVKPGDTLYSIAKRFNMDYDTLLEINDIRDENVLVVGEALIILTNLNTTYIVQSGDTLASIAKKYDIPLKEILDINPSLTPPYVLYPGQTLTIEKDEEKRKHILLNGFSYATSKTEEVANALTDLSFLSLFSYRYDKEGHLLDLQDERLIALTKEYESTPLMVISNQDEKGLFSTSYADKLLNDTKMQENLFSDTINKLKSTLYAGLIIDFEYIDPLDTKLFLDFLRKFKEQLKSNGNYMFFIALAPKYSSTQKGILYEAHDYKQIGEIVDYVILMAYEWGYTYGPPMAVSPINEVRRVIEYAISVIPRDKIMLGYPNYGYDFTLPYVKGKSKAKVIANKEIPSLAKRKHAIIEYDSSQQSPFFKYQEDGINHIVYFSDARSILAKSKLIKEYDLKGISVWTLNKYYAPIFEIITNLYIVDKINDK